MRSCAAALLLKARVPAGRVVLASGRGNFYFDMKPAMLDPDGVVLMVD
jgi:hypothetical protein